jgi:hypothetical protein
MGRCRKHVGYDGEDLGDILLDRGSCAGSGAGTSYRDVCGDGSLWLEIAFLCFCNCNGDSGSALFGNAGISAVQSSTQRDEDGGAQDQFRSTLGGCGRWETRREDVCEDDTGIAHQTLLHGAHRILHLDDGSDGLRRHLPLRTYRILPSKLQ